MSSAYYRFNTEARKKPRLSDQPPEQGQHAETGNKRKCKPLCDVLQLEVPELVCQNRLDLRRQQPLDQRVEKYDALRAAESCEVRITVCRASGAVHHEYAFARETRPA